MSRTPADDVPIADRRLFVLRNSFRRADETPNMINRQKNQIEKKRNDGRKNRQRITV